MRRMITAAIVLSTVLGCSLAYAAGTSNYVLVEKFSSLYYPAPAAWSCKDKKGCVECENISTDPTPVFVKLQPDDIQIQHSVPAGSKVKSCGELLFVPGDVPVL